MRFIDPSAPLSDCITIEGYRFLILVFLISCMLYFVVHGFHVDRIVTMYINV
jgi:hypothetical protein